MPAVGSHMVLNAIAAATAARELGLTAEQAAAGIESYSPVGHRGRVEKLCGFTLVDDCYNAGPESMAAALSILARRKTDGRRIAHRSRAGDRSKRSPVLRPLSRP